MLINTSKKDKPMGFIFVSERSNMDNRDISSIDIYDKHGVFFVSFEAVLHSFGVMNRNQRMYVGENVWEAITSSEKIQSCLADSGWFGEMNHPTQYYKSAELTPQRLQDIDMNNRSHKIMRPRLSGNLLKAHIETASGTDSGVGFAKEIIQGLKPAFSCRAVATMQMLQNKPTVNVRKLITYDWVLYPSHKEAHIISEPKLIEKSASMFRESGEDDNDYSPDFTMPLEYILKDTGERDENVNAIMESFELDFNDLIGFDETHTHAIIKDRDNRIYANINPETKRRVDNFFASF